jgi:hypothetical protein
MSNPFQVLSEDIISAEGEDGNEEQVTSQKSECGGGLHTIRRDFQAIP